MEHALQLVLAEEVTRNPAGRKKCLRGSLGGLCKRLEECGHHANPKTVAKLMRKLGYSLKKTTGRKPNEVKDPEIESALQDMLSEEIAGDPMSSQRWIRSSLRNLSKRLEERGHSACTHTVARLLRKMGYSLQVAKKKQAGAQHPDRTPTVIGSSTISPS
jgi:transposase